MPKITANTITDNQILELRFATPLDDSEVEHVTFFAVRGSGRYRARARARCAAIINTRSNP